MPGILGVTSGSPGDSASPADPTTNPVLPDPAAMPTVDARDALGQNASSGPTARNLSNLVTNRRRGPKNQAGSNTTTAPDLPRYPVASGETLALSLQSEFPTDPAGLAVPASRAEVLPAPIPEPSSLALFSLAATAFLGQSLVRRTRANPRPRTKRP